MIYVHVKGRLASNYTKSRQNIYTPINGHLVEVVGNLDAIAEANQKLDYSMAILERELSQCIAVSNKSRRFGSFNELMNGAE
jgi:hypothetical protein